MKTIVFATQNPNKVAEFNLVLKNTEYKVVTMGELGYNEDIPETGQTLEENALIKARYLRERETALIVSEDTGLEIKALNGAPGVHTARYAGPEKDAQANMDKVLTQLKDKKNRKARFRAVLALIDDTGEQLFEGIVDGQIAVKKAGSGGFGYDPIFIPEGHDSTFAQMSDEMKKSMSHRARALENLLIYLRHK